MATTLNVVHPIGRVGRSTTVYMLGAELALCGHRVALIDRDQGQHLSRILQFYPLAVDWLLLGDRDDVDVRIVDTAPEVDSARALGYLCEADWAIVPVKGPEAGSVLALPLLMHWLDQGPRRAVTGLPADEVQGPPRRSAPMAGRTSQTGRPMCCAHFSADRRSRQPGCLSPG